MSDELTAAQRLRVYAALGGAVQKITLNKRDALEIAHAIETLEELQIRSDQWRSAYRSLLVKHNEIDRRAEWAARVCIAQFAFWALAAWAGLL